MSREAIISRIQTMPFHSAALDRPEVDAIPRSDDLCAVVGDNGSIATVANRLCWIPASSCEDPGKLTLLGYEAGSPRWSTDADNAPGDESPMVSLRSFAGTGLPQDAAIACEAVAVEGWLKRTRFCERCGLALTRPSSRPRLTCSSCGTELFPRIDPAVIAIVTDGDRCVLARRSRGARGMWSTIAGFVEAGETAEAAVIREVREECGVAVATPEYVGSQPWPFPRSLMIGFIAPLSKESPRELHKSDEHEEVRWFGKEELREGIASDTISVPPPISLGSALIAGWLDPAE